MKRRPVYAIDVARAYKKRRLALGYRPRTAPVRGAGVMRRVGYYGRYTRNANRKRISAGLQPEKKFFDTAIAFNFDSTGEVPATGQLTLIPQGDTESTRDGRQAVIKSVQIRGVVSYAPAASAAGATIGYLYLVLDTQCNGAAAAITDVFTSNVMATNLLNLNNSGRFRILKKWVCPQTSQAGVSAAYGGNQKQIEFYKKCNIPVDWSAATGAITEIRSNNLFLMAGSTSDDLQGFQGSCRLRFMG